MGMERGPFHEARDGALPVADGGTEDGPLRARAGVVTIAAVRIAPRAEAIETTVEPVVLLAELRQLIKQGLVGPASWPEAHVDVTGEVIDQGARLGPFEE